MSGHPLGQTVGPNRPTTIHTRKYPLPHLRNCPLRGVPQPIISKELGNVKIMELPFFVNQGENSPRIVSGTLGRNLYFFLVTGLFLLETVARQPRLHKMHEPHHVDRKSSIFIFLKAVHQKKALFLTLKSKRLLTLPTTRKRRQAARRGPNGSCPSVDSRVGAERRRSETALCLGRGEDGRGMGTGGRGDHVSG